MAPKPADVVDVTTQRRIASSVPGRWMPGTRPAWDTRGSSSLEGVASTVCVSELVRAKREDRLMSEGRVVVLVRSGLDGSVTRLGGGRW